jgi:hypothetical protein
VDSSPFGTGQMDLIVPMCLPYNLSKFSDWTHDAFENDAARAIPNGCCAS